MNIKDKNGDCEGCGKGKQASKAKSTAQPQSFMQTYWLGMLLAGIGIGALVLFFASSSSVNDITTTMTIEEVAPPKPAPKVTSISGEGLSQLNSIGGGIVETLEAVGVPIFLAALVFAGIAFFSGRGWGMVVGILIGGLILGNPTIFAAFFGIS